LNYYYNDKIITSETLYYRLSQMDFDGVFKHSAVISLSCMGQKTEPVISIYPNPFNTQLNIAVENWDNDEFYVELYDITGKKIQDWKDANVPVEFIKTIEIKGLSAGMYTIKITSAEKVFVRKLEKE